MDFRQFEREFLRLAYTTDADLTPPTLAFVTDIPIEKAETYFKRLVGMGVLELDVDDAGHLVYHMPSRPAQPMSLDDPALIGSRRIHTRVLTNGDDLRPQPPPAAMVVRSMPPAFWDPRPIGSGQAVASMFLNAMVCPGVGSLVGGKTNAGLAQLALFLIGLPLAVVAVGIPLMLTAWVWGIATGAQLLSEARD